MGSDNTEAGKLCGNDLIEKYPDGGTVAILEATTQNSVNDRITGFEQAVAKAEKGFEVVAREDTNGTFDSALEAAKKILEEQPDVDGNHVWKRPDGCCSKDSTESCE